MLQWHSVPKGGGTVLANMDIFGSESVTGSESVCNDDSVKGITGPCLLERFANHSGKRVRTQTQANLRGKIRKNPVGVDRDSIIFAQVFQLQENDRANHQVFCIQTLAQPCRQSVCFAGMEPDNQMGV